MSRVTALDAEPVPYVIHAKLKNNLILSRILRSYATVNEFCRETGLRPREVGQFVNMKRRAVTRDGDWSIPALRLAEALNEIPEDLFNDEQRVANLQSNEAFIELTREQALGMANPVERIDATKIVQRIMRDVVLTRRERQVLQLRYLDEQTLEEVGASLDLTRERIRQLERQALRKCKEHLDSEDARQETRHDEIRKASPVYALSIATLNERDAVAAAIAETEELVEANAHLLGADELADVKRNTKAAAEAARGWWRKYQKNDDAALKHKG